LTGAEAPVTVELTAYGDSEPDEIRETTVFIINSASECGSDWMGLAWETVPRRAIIGEPSGPTVSGDGNSNGRVGLGGLTAPAAVGAGAAATYLWGGDGEE